MGYGDCGLLYKFLRIAGRSLVMWELGVWIKKSCECGMFRVKR